VIPTRTVVWTAGIEVNPLLQSVDLPKNGHGALIVNNRLQVEGHPNIFALGDCAAVPVSIGEGTYAPTAQNAIREGPVAAENIVCLIHKIGSLKAYDYQPIGSLASLGHRQAVAQIGRFQLSGLPAWFAWRGIYLFKLPTLADRMLVLLNWITDLVAPVDVVQVPQGRQQRVLPGKRPFEPVASAADSSTAARQPAAPDEQPAAGQKVPS
jgi:NADH dehydrogenase